MMAHLSKKKLSMKKFTLIELLIVITILGILVTILLPSIHNVREKAKSSLCMSNQSQIYKGANVSLKMNNGKVPIGSSPALRYSMPMW